MRCEVLFRLSGLSFQIIGVRLCFSLDIDASMVHKLMNKNFSISETARLLGVHRGTIRRWINSGRVPQPVAVDTAGARLRYCDKNGFDKVKEYKVKHFGEGKGKRNDLKGKRKMNGVN